MRTRLISRTFCVAAVLHIAGLACGQSSTAFTYQGELANSAALASGSYDLEFRLFDLAGGGLQVGPTLCSDNVAVAGGKFTVQLDFGAVFASSKRFLQVAVRQDTGLACANAAGFVTLSPRQEVTSTPQAMFATSAGNANTLGGQPATFFTNASNLTSGTIPDSRIASTVARTNTNQTFSGVINMNNVSNVFAGSGAGLVGLNASNVSAGVLSDARLSGNIPRLDAVNTFAAANNFLGDVGIGTSTPEGNLHVRSAAGSTLGKMVLTPGTSDAMSELWLCENTTASRGFILRYDGAVNNQLQFVGLNGDVESGSVLTLDRDTNSASFGGNVTVPAFVAVGSITSNVSQLSMVSASSSEPKIVFASDNGTSAGVHFLPFLGSRMELRTAGQPRIHIDETGNVGIGTTGPVDRLTVSGDVRAIGDVIVTGTVRTSSVTLPTTTRWKHFSGASVGAVTDGVVLMGFSPPIIGPSASVLPGTTRGVFAVELPHDAIVTELRSIWSDSESALNGSLELVRSDAATGVEVVMASAGSTGTSGLQTRTDTTIASATIDNETYTYFLRLSVPFEPSATILWRGARLKYTITSPTP